VVWQKTFGDIGNDSILAKNREIALVFVAILANIGPLRRICIIIAWNENNRKFNIMCI
jgi:hypothetical protein